VSVAFATPFQRTGRYNRSSTRRELNTPVHRIAVLSKAHQHAKESNLFGDVLVRELLGRTRRAMRSDARATVRAIHARSSAGVTKKPAARAGFRAMREEGASPLEQSSRGGISH
jgi:hypothetical protein